MSHGHTVELRLGLVCNQHCGHCSRHTTRRDPRDEGEPLVRLQELLAAGAREVVLTGGEPTLSPLLLTAIRQCVAAGAAAVLETNGLLLAGQAARQRLWDAGLRRVRLHWPAHDAATYAAVTRDEAGFGHAVTALEALLAMGVAVELSVPVLASNVAHIPDMARDPRIAGVRALRFVTWKDEAATGSPHHPLPQLWQAALDGAWQALQARGITPILPPGGGLPACLLQHPDAVPWLVARSPRPVDLPADCTGCALAAQCPGPPPGLLQQHPGLALHAVASRRVVRQVEALHPHSQPDDNYLRTVTETAADGRAVVREVLLRVVQQCNERCRFCWVDFEAPPCPDAVVDAAMAEVAAAAPRGGERLGGAMLSLTGGEPMLRKDLTSLVRRGREAGAWAVQLQTNATLVTAEQAALLAAAGLTHALVGLHAADAATYGEITTTPQLFERALAGVAALLSVGVEVTVNCVLTTATAQQAVGLVDLLADLGERAGRRPILSFAAAADIAGGPLDAASLPRLSELAGPLRQALERCIERHQPFAGLAHPCGVPPCILGADLRFYPDLLRWQFAETPLHDRPAACQSCVLAAYCPGLRPAYLQRHGDRELAPLTAWPAPPEPPLPALVTPLAPPDRPLHAVVVGAGAMGVLQARWLRELDPAARVAVLSRRAPLSGSPPGLPPDVAVHPPQALGQLAGVDLVSVCTATTDRERDVAAWIGRLAALPPRQRPWLLVEKPLAATAAAAQSLAELAVRHGVVMLVQQTVVATPGWRALQAALGGRAIRRLTIVRHEPARPAEAQRDHRELATQHLLHELALVADALAGQVRLDRPPTVHQAQWRRENSTLYLALALGWGDVGVEIRSQLGGEGDSRREVTLQADGATGTWREGPQLRSAHLELAGQTTALAVAAGNGRAAAVQHVAALARGARGRGEVELDGLARGLAADRAAGVVAWAQVVGELLFPAG